MDRDPSLARRVRRARFLHTRGADVEPVGLDHWPGVFGGDLLDGVRWVNGRTLGCWARRLTCRVADIGRCLALGRRWSVRLTHWRRVHVARRRSYRRQLRLSARRRRIA